MCETTLLLHDYIWYITIPPVSILILLGIFILVTDFKKNVNRIYFFITLFLTIWALADAFSFKLSNPVHVNFADRVSSLGLVAAAFIVLFLHVFPEYKKIDKKIFVSLFAPLALFLIIVPTNLYIGATGVAPACETATGPLFFLQIILVLFYAALGVFISFRKFKVLDVDQKKQFKLFAIGSVLMLLLGVFVDVIPTLTGDESLILFTPYSTAVFAIFCAYAIVKYKAMNAKVIAAQMLTVATWVLIGSQFFFVENSTNIILIGLTLSISLGFGYMLIKSVKKESERKEELQQMADKLAQANDKLRKLDNAKTEFISIASHQLRTPITAIKGFTSLLLEGSYGEMNEAVHGALDKIYTSADRLVNLIEDLLNVSRIESGRMQFLFEKASVEKLIKELNDNFLLIAKTKKFFLDVKLPENPLPEIVMDYSKIRELVSNFVDNALKYTEKGGATIKAELRDEGVVVDEKGFVIEGQKSPFGKVVRITVSDTGIGIPKEEIPYLFKKFSRGKDVSRLHVGGTGLGLYVGKAIAEAHHGQVWVESDGAGLGSRFIIEIPVEHKN